MRWAFAAAVLLTSASVRADEPAEPLAPWPEPPPPDPKPAPEPLPKPEPPLLLPPPTPPEELPDPWRFVIAGNGRVDLGMLPSMGVGLGGGIGMRFSRVRFDLEATFWFPQDKRVEGTPAGADFRLFTGALTGCPLILRDPIELGPCVGIELGRLGVESYGTLNAGETAMLWAAFVGDVQATWVFAAPFALRAELGAVVPFRRPRWIVQEGALDRPGLAGARAQLGLELHL